MGWNIADRLVELSITGGGNTHICDAVHISTGREGPAIYVEDQWAIGYNEHETRVDVISDEALTLADVIAAAPELLEALEAMLREFACTDDSNLCEPITVARAVIKKARGQ